MDQKYQNLFNEAGSHLADALCGFKDLFDNLYKKYIHEKEKSTQKQNENEQLIMDYFELKKRFDLLKEENEKFEKENEKLKEEIDSLKNTYKPKRRYMQVTGPRHKRRLH